MAAKEPNGTKKRNPAAHLKRHQWKPGQSGNPAGPKKRPTFESLVAVELDKKLPGSDISKRQALAQLFVDEMLRANGSFIRDWMEREWPKVQQHKLEMEQPKVIDIESDDDRRRQVVALTAGADDAPADDTVH